MNIYLDLFATFFRIGLFTFGGGLAMLPMLEKEVVQKKGWATYDELVDYFAIGQCTPGIIAVNTATFVGYTKKKWKGAAIATLGVVSPSLVIIIFIASLMTSFASLEIVQHALAGIRIGVCVLIGQAVWKMMKTGVKDVYGLVIFLVILLASYFNWLPVVLCVVFAMICALIYCQIVKKKTGVSPALKFANSGVPQKSKQEDHPTEKQEQKSQKEGDAS
ncbi:chromate transporter [Allobaculum stercoricanis]|uniref:chromate transporter n=1 Tax=Allobaculum stercoricanis TaxID=174709 RepID=UPI000366309C|nr:chromate transporter [Allobaculum stercoricanis]